MSEPVVTAADIPWNGTPGGRASQPTASPLLRDTLHAIETFIRKYVVLTADQARIVTLWIAHSHALAAADWYARSPDHERDSS